MHCEIVEQDICMVAKPSSITWPQVASPVTSVRIKTSPLPLRVGIVFAFFCTRERPPTWRPRAALSTIKSCATRCARSNALRRGCATSLSSPTARCRAGSTSSTRASRSWCAVRRECAGVFSFSLGAACRPGRADAPQMWPVASAWCAPASVRGCGAEGCGLSLWPRLPAHGFVMRADVRGCGVRGGVRG